MKFNVLSKAPLLKESAPTNLLAKANSVLLPR